jgi:hypothetical protein
MTRVYYIGMGRCLVASYVFEHSAHEFVDWLVDNHGGVPLVLIREPDEENPDGLRLHTITFEFTDTVWAHLAGLPWETVWPAMGPVRTGIEERRG